MTEHTAPTELADVVETHNRSAVGWEWKISNRYQIAWLRGSDRLTFGANYNDQWHHFGVMGPERWGVPSGTLADARRVAHQFITEHRSAVEE